jgi:hypothetical protein
MYLTSNFCGILHSSKGKEDCVTDQVNAAFRNRGELEHGNDSQNLQEPSKQEIHFITDVRKSMLTILLAFVIGKIIGSVLLTPQYIELKPIHNSPLSL